MLKTHEKFRLIDKNGKNDFFAEVNFREDPLIQDCQVIKFTFPDGKEAFLDRKLFLEMCFAIGQPSEQRSMIPQIIKKVHTKETMFGVKATKDIKKGQMVNFSAKVDFECPYFKEESFVEGL